MTASRGVVTAPAGCGKTYLIAEALARYQGAKPILILTHTNAGVAALRQRLKAAGADPSRFRLSTIDGWAMRLIGTFPVRSGHNAEILAVRRPGDDYPAIRASALGLLAAGHVDDVITASYAQLIVDEYQDCSIPQHRIVQYLSHLLPTCVLGDPMQAIFNFAEPVAHWDREVCMHFAHHGTLKTPWRWRNAQSEALGQWLLDVRGKLASGQSIDLRHGPSAHVTWIQITPATAAQQRLAAARTPAASPEHRVLIIGDSRRVDSRCATAVSTPGAVVVEAVDLRDLVEFASRFRLGSTSAHELLTFADRLLTNTSAQDMLRRLDTLAAGRARKPATDAEAVALSFRASPTYEQAARLLEELYERSHVRVVRPGIFFAAIRMFRRAASSESSLLDAAVAIREEYRLLGRPLPRRGVGSTLLLKGLEAEVAVILDGDSLDRSNLYVAMTRGSMRLVICSQSPVLGMR